MRLMRAIARSSNPRAAADSSVATGRGAAVALVASCSDYSGKTASTKIAVGMRRLADGAGSMRPGSMSWLDVLPAIKGASMLRGLSKL